jgi:hypothetical protein
MLLLERAVAGTGGANHVLDRPAIALRERPSRELPGGPAHGTLR